MKKASEVRVQWHPEHFSGWMVEARHLISDWLAHLASIGVDDVAIVGFANAHANFALHSYTIEANGVEYCCCYASEGSFFRCRVLAADLAGWRADRGIREPVSWSGTWGPCGSPCCGHQVPGSPAR